MIGLHITRTDDLHFRMTRSKKSREQALIHPFLRFDFTLLIQPDCFDLFSNGKCKTLREDSEARPYSSEGLARLLQQSGKYFCRCIAEG